MIDLSALGLAVAQRTSGDKRDQADQSQADDQDARKFGDYVNAAGKKSGGKDGAEDDKLATGRVAANDDAAAADAAIDLTALEEPLNADDFPAIDDTAVGKTKVAKDGGKPVPANAMDIIAAAGDTADAASTDGLAEAKTSFSQGLLQIVRLNAASGKGQPNATPADTHNEVKAASNDSKTLLVAKLNKAKESDQAAIASPAQELRVLLALANDDGTDSADQAAPASAKKSKSDEKDKADDLDLTATDATVTKAGAEPTVTTQTAIQHAASILGVKGAAADAADETADPKTDTSKLPAISLDGKVSTDATEATISEGKSDSAGNKTDIVTVLDARRYLGFENAAAGNVSANAGALTDALKGDTSWAQAIQNAKHGGEATATVVNTLKLQMSPEHLGNMTASLRLKGDELSVEVRVETMDAYRQLSGDQDGIVKALQKHGFAIDQVTVQLSPAARADSGQTGGDNSQNNGGGAQNMQDGNQGETARQREDNTRRNANQTDWNGNDRTSTSSDSGSRSDATDTGNLYL